MRFTLLVVVVVVVMAAEGEGEARRGEGGTPARCARAREATRRC